MIIDIALCSASTPKLSERYLVEELIGCGGEGAVYRAFDSVNESTVAVKVCPNVNMRQYFVCATEALMNIESDHIVRIQDIQYDKMDNCFVVMELIEGGDLLDLITSNTRLFESAAVGIFSQVVQALHTSHAHGIYHLDLKPENVLIDTTGRQGVAQRTGEAVACTPMLCAKLTDYGTSLALDIASAQVVLRRGRSLSEGSESSHQSMSSSECDVEVHCTTRKTDEAEETGETGDTMALMELCEEMELSTAYLAPECSQAHLDESLSQALIDMLNALCDGSPSVPSCASATATATASSSSSSSSSSGGRAWSSKALAAIDVWGLGVTLFVMCAGHTPWGSASSIGGVEDFTVEHIPFPAHFSPSLRSLLRKMLQVDPTMRVTLEEIALDPWLRTATAGGVAAVPTGVQSTSIQAATSAPKPTSVLEKRRLRPRPCTPTTFLA